MDSNASTDQQNSAKLAPCCCGTKNQEIVATAATEEKNQLISKIIRILIRAVGIFVARKVILWAIGFGPYGVIPRSLATKLIAYAQHSKIPLKGLVALLQSGGTGFTPSKGYLAFVAGQIILVVAPELKSRLMKSREELAQQYGANLAKVHILTKDIADNSNNIDSGASLRPKLSAMEATQTNNPSFTSINKDLEIPKSPAAGSQEVWQKAAKLTEAGFYAAIWYMGVPSPLIPVIKCSADLAISIVTDPQVQQTASQIGSQIGSTTKGAYFWTARTASSAKDKTTQAVSYTYNYTIEKTSQGINYSRDLMPSLWWKYNSNMTNQKIPGLSYGIAYFGNQYKRQSISQDDNGVKV